MQKRRVLICNERFLPRFGVDRILVMLGRHLSEQGMDVTFAYLRADDALLGGIAAKQHRISLPDGLDIAGADASVCRTLLSSWDAELAEKPDVIVCGGWPFFGIASVARHSNISSIFIDAGAVPHDGFDHHQLPSQLELRRLRQRMLPGIGTILPISNFIRDSQTKSDRGNAGNVETVLLGADHLAAGSDLSVDESEQIARLAGRNDQLVLVLGRFEAKGYKNSPAAFGVFRGILQSWRRARLLILAGPDRVDVPEDLRDHVTCLPTISDAMLRKLMIISVLGLSMSLWEGFNLPLVEMQSCGRPVLAFNLGAHPEVTIDPWYLCESDKEMSLKAIEVLDGVPQVLASRQASSEEFNKRFKWERTLQAWQSFIEMHPAMNGDAQFPKRLVLMDVTNSARDPANSGVIRVTRRLAAELSRLDDLIVVFVAWDAERQTYALLSKMQRDYLCSNAGPVDWFGALAPSAMDATSLLTVGAELRSRQAVMMTSEIALDDSATDKIRWIKENDLKSAGIFYDMIPVFNTDSVDQSVADAFPIYIDAMTEMNALWSISAFSLSELERYLKGRTLPRQARAVKWLPGQFSDHPRVDEASTSDDPLRILCVSTIEPRKNHKVLIKAYQLLRRRRSDLAMSLMLVGNRYVGAGELTSWLEGILADDRTISWSGILSDESLADAYKSATFTAYASLAEGYGLPIMESLWMGKACICHNGGVMAELAADGGCLMADMNNAAEVADALERLLTDRALRQRLEAQARSRAIPTWRDYALGIADGLKAL